MIYVTTGSAVKGIEFIRLIKKMDEIARKIEEEVIMQIGFINYKPKYAKYFRYIPYQENLTYFEKASLIIGHCGIGTILNALRFKKPIIVVPRRFKYGELNRDDHQIDIAKRLIGRNLIKVVYDVEELEKAIKNILGEEKIIENEELFVEKSDLINTIKNFIKNS